jgi:hypothetical protein
MAVVYILQPYNLKNMDRYLPPFPSQEKRIQYREIGELMSNTSILQHLFPGGKGVKVKIRVVVDQQLGGNDATFFSCRVDS